MTDTSAVELATELTVAWLSNPSTRANADDVQAFVRSMSDTLAGLTAAPVSEPEEAAPADYVPAVSARKSLASREHIVSMIDGRPYKTLRRHLATNGLTPDEYRARYNLKADYPMVAPAYSESRSATAKRLGLGRKPGGAAAPTADAAPSDRVPEPAPSGRKPRAGKGFAIDTVPSAAAPEQTEPAAKGRTRRSPSEARAAARRHLGD